jgi:hypothetical protein
MQIRAGNCFMSASLAAVTVDLKKAYVLFYCCVPNTYAWRGVCTGFTGILSGPQPVASKVFVAGRGRGRGPKLTMMPFFKYYVAAFSPVQV